MPASAADTMLMTMAMAITSPKPGEANHAQASAPVMTANTTPLSRPTVVSRVMMRRAL